MKMGVRSDTFLRTASSHLRFHSKSYDGNALKEATWVVSLGQGQGMKNQNLPNSFVA